MIIFHTLILENCNNRKKEKRQRKKEKKKKPNKTKKQDKLNFKEDFSKQIKDRYHNGL